MKHFFGMLICSSAVLLAGSAKLCAENLIAQGVTFDAQTTAQYPGIQFSVIHRPDADYKFLHDPMITSFKGSLYTCWYNCPEAECQVTSVIRGRRSDDGGKTWTDVQWLAGDKTMEYQYVPASFAEADGNLYLLVKRFKMNAATDKNTGESLVQHLVVCKLNEADKIWKEIRAFDSGFLPNTNGIRMENGKLIIGGRNVFKNKPSVLIFDSGNPEKGDAREVLFFEKPEQGSKWACPESSLTVNGKEITCYVRCQEAIAFIGWKSGDYGETWQKFDHNVPVGKSKMYSGKLSDGRFYLIFTPRTYQANRNRLMLALTKKGETQFSEFYLLRADLDKDLNAREQWSYPCAVEQDGKLYIVCTCRDASPEYEKIKKSACCLMILPLK